MPRNVRNFWIELVVDGKKTKIATGPVSKTGGFELTIKARNEGEILPCYWVRGLASDSGDLKITVSDREYLRLVTRTKR